MAIHFRRALLPDGWQDNVSVSVADGRIAAVEIGVEPAPGDDRSCLGLPGAANVHSHGFQRAMAGLAEHPGAGGGTFWTWRELMYRFLDTLTPDDVEAVTAMAFLEMLENGFTTVGEFHYLHHDRDGRAFEAPAEMGARIVAAAAATGIALVLLPAFYAHSGFGGAPPAAGQKRFVCDIDSFARLVEDAARALATLPGARLGVAPHSLRAVTPAELEALAAMAATRPIHIHIAEQEKEVADCVAWSGRRPIEWLLDNATVGPTWCLIHAIHATDFELSALAASGAVVGVCAITEANLGDGTFQARAWIGEGGRYAIGTDSNVSISLAAELRQLEYGQRLAMHARNVLAVGGRSTGRSLYEAALQGGAAALGSDPPGFVEGAAADIVSLDAPEPLVDTLDGDALLDVWIFADAAVIDSVWRGGKKLVADGRHRAREAVEGRFRQTMTKLLGR